MISMKKISGILVGLCLVCGAGQVYAQLPVQEVGTNLFYNSVQAADAVVNTASWLLNLASFETFAITDGTFANDLQTLRTIYNDGTAVMGDLSSLQSQLDGLFNVEHAPYTSAGIAARMYEVQTVVFQIYSYAMRTQTLINTTLGVIDDINQLAFDLMSILGVVNGTQMIAMQQSRMLNLQTELKVQTTAYQRAVSTAALSDPMLERALQHFNNRVWLETEP
jgi:hypothetical protein